MENTYKNDIVWQEIEKILPLDFRFSNTATPVEELFHWRNSLLHVDRFSNPRSPHKVILHHGVGTNGRLLSLIVGVPLAKRGYEVVSIDMPFYGMTINREPSILYSDWIEIGQKLIEQESKRDNKPIVLYGLSAGGMLAYHLACLKPEIKGIVGMCFIDLNESYIRELISPYPALIERAFPLLLNLLMRTPLRTMRIPTKLFSKMTTLVNDKKALSILIKDLRSGGSKVSFEFLHSLLNCRYPILPENFTHCPVLLTQPAADRWTPLIVSQAFMDKLNVRKQITMLENAGHYPLEQPGLNQMVEAIHEFILSV